MLIQRDESGRGGEGGKEEVENARWGMGCSRHHLKKFFIAKEGSGKREEQTA